MRYGIKTPISTKSHEADGKIEYCHGDIRDSVIARRDFERRFFTFDDRRSLQRLGGTLSIKATAVVKKETKVDPKKPNDKAFYASLSLLNETAKSTAPHVI